jgi:hypothetical protein
MRAVTPPLCKFLERNPYPAHGSASRSNAGRLPKRKLPDRAWGRANDGSQWAGRSVSCRRQSRGYPHLRVRSGRHRRILPAPIASTHDRHVQADRGCAATVGFRRANRRRRSLDRSGRHRQTSDPLRKELPRPLCRPGGENHQMPRNSFLARVYRH